MRLAAALAAAALTLVACGSRAPSPGPAPATSPVAARASGASAAAPYPVGLRRYPPAERRPLPLVSGPALDGPGVSTRDLRGQIVVINVWASWCAPCREEAHVLVALASSPQARRARVRWLGIDENDDPASARAFLQTAGRPAGGSTIPDDGTRLRALAAWLPPALPGTLVVDRQGRVAARVVGAVSAGQLDPVLAELAGP